MKNYCAKGVVKSATESAKLTAVFTQSNTVQGGRKK